VTGEHSAFIAAARNKALCRAVFGSFVVVVFYLFFQKQKIKVLQWLLSGRIVA
jgi:hypothetical protein